MKVCKDCNEVKRLCEFVKDNRTHDGRTNQCKECVNNKRRIDYKENPTKYYKHQKMWRKTEKGKLYLRKAGRMPYAKRFKKEWAQNNKKEIKTINDRWRKENPETYAIICRRHARKSSARRRRNLGYKPINKREAGNVGHHIDKELVIYIPEKLHRLVPHAQSDLTSMKEINTLAIQVAYI